MVSVARAPMRHEDLAWGDLGRPFFVAPGCEVATQIFRLLCLTGRMLSEVTLRVVMDNSRRFVVLALLVVAALTGTGAAWSALALTGRNAQACCHGACPDARARAQPCRGPCCSLGLCGCGSQPLFVTTSDALDTPPVVFALASSIPDLLSPPTHLRALALPSKSITPLLVQHAILRL